MGINWCTPTKVCSGPAMFAGMKVAELWTIQGSTKHKLMIGHLRKTDVISDTIVVGLDCLQLQAGTSWQVLSHEGSHVRTYVDWWWASHLWEFNNHTISPSAMKINLGFSPNNNMTNSSWKLSLISQKLQKNDWKAPNAADCTFKSLQQQWHPPCWMGHKPKVCPSIPQVSKSRLTQHHHVEWFCKNASACFHWRHVQQITTTNGRLVSRPHLTILEPSFPSQWSQDLFLWNQTLPSCTCLWMTVN